MIFWQSRSANEANNYEAVYAAFDAAWMPYAKAIRAAAVPIAGPQTGFVDRWMVEALLSQVRVCRLA